MAKAAMNEIWGISFIPINMAGMAILAAKVRVRFLMMVWLEGGQGEVRGACAPTPATPQIAPPGTPPPPHTHHPNSPHLDPPPTSSVLCYGAKGERTCPSLLCRGAQVRGTSPSVLC